ncbi:hypothetical protein D3C85_1786380 [compost metagenome]
MALHFVSSLRGHGATLYFWIVGDHAHRHAIQARQCRHDRAPLVAADLEQGVMIEDGFQDAGGIVDFRAIAQNAVFEPVFHAVW